MSLAPLPRRRNGRPQACEPCRKRKIACDHALPVCGRCKRRKAAAGCIYLPAPMTHKPAVEPEPEPELELELDIPIPGISALPALGITSPGLRKQSVRSTATSNRTGDVAVLSNTSVFFGPTSFSAVFHEELGTDFHAGASGMGPDDAAPRNPGVEDDSWDAPFVRLGAKALRGLPDQQMCNLLLERHRQTVVSDGWFKPAVQQCADLLYATYGKKLSGSRPAVGIECVARMLCQTGRTALQEPNDPDDSREWIRSFSGENMRWEALGMILSCCCHGALASPENYMFTSGDGRRKGKMQLVHELKENVSICVTLCSHTDFVNPVIVSLLYNNCYLLSVLSSAGDTSFLLWRHHADLVSATTALGLHRESDSRDNKVTIGSEVRRRIYASVYNIDKSLASFTGRPPFLSHRYSSCPMPLDLSDEQLLQSRDERAKSVAKLDSHGWNTDGVINPGTYLRVNVQISQIKDEILEISLGSWNECLPNCIYDLRERSEKVYASFPRHMKYEPGDPSEPTIPGIGVRLKHLQNHFLLERLAMKYGETDGQTLLDISREMLSLTLILYTNRDQYVGCHHIYEWIIVCYGVPACGILCLELLKQMKNPTAQRLSLPRSETIQKLSMFIGFLNWVRSTAPNYEICVKMRDTISRILDDILEEPQPMHTSLSQPLLNFDVAPPTAVNLFDFDTFGDYDMLGDTDWMKAPWMGIP